jgi:DNA-binding transcriptional ArsR family regulator/predicted transcriptional regulator
MIGPLDMAGVAALVGDPARATMLAALMDGRALTATELALDAGISPQTASGHLAKLVDAHLLTVLKQGRHRYHRLGSPLIGRMLEGIMAVAAIEAPPRHRPRSARDDAMCFARTCYDHLAGRLGVALADALVERGLVQLDDDGGQVTTEGRHFLDDFGIEDAAAHARRNAFCRPCLDWSERRWHLGGRLGVDLARRCFDLGWIERRRDSRVVTLTPKGRRGFEERFGIAL